LNEFKLSKNASQQVHTSIKEGVGTVMMNRPDKLNGWTLDMMDAIKAAFTRGAELDDVKVILLTGSGSYYSAGANLGGSLKPMHPRKLRQLIVEQNQHLFEAFLLCPKPILVAINGPAMGASVTSATLCNGIIASERATFSTPFAALGITPEGCSSIHFPRLLGARNAQRMIGAEGW
jgi:enoyl-CoA hydratase/carnithine racemase